MSAAELDLTRAALELSKCRADVLEREVASLQALIDQLGEDPNPDSEEPADCIKRHHAKAWEWCRIANDALAETRALREKYEPKKDPAMMAEVLEQEVQPDSVPPPGEATLTLAEVQPDHEQQLNHVLDIAEAMAQQNDKLTAQVAKHQRKQAVQISVRYDEREFPPVILLKLHTLRQEINNLNKAQRSANQTITRLRHEVRLRDRVMKLKAEAANDGEAKALQTIGQSLNHPGLD